MATLEFNDLRQYLELVKREDHLRLYEGVDWDLEMGAITELQCAVPNNPLLLFDAVKGYPPGYRVVSNVVNTPSRVALALGLPHNASKIEMVKALRKKLNAIKGPIEPVEVPRGPVMENVITGKDVDILKFPIAKWHQLDGGRYITGGMVILKDPDSGFVNLGCYRVQAFDQNVATIHIVDRRHGALIRNKYWERGMRVPAAVVCGQDPRLWYASTLPVPWGTSEYGYAGALANRPIETVKGITTGLPVPATAEIVLEGEIHLPGGETRIEGPMGEWAGYFAGDRLPEPIFEVKSVMHRNDPIIFGAPVNIGAHDFYNGASIIGSAMVWDKLDNQVPGIQGLWISSEARSGIMIIISIRQLYPGHAKQVGIAATGINDRLNRWVIVVDEDIDPSNIGEVLWALGTRCDPATAIDVIDNCWGMRSDPLLSPEKRARGEITASKALVYACKPFHWMHQFPPSLKSSAELLERVRKKFEL
ncbi:MAG: UbiD family decarboxylase [Burkholderiales bacterium]|nr:UbiD family decarboxylase [Burkholderiales bacterium]